MPSTGLLFSIAGLSVSLAGFSGLVVAFRRGGALRPIDAYRLQQIPELGLTTALIAVISIPVADAVGSGALAVRFMSAAVLVFTLAHVATLYVLDSAWRFTVGERALCIFTPVDFKDIDATAASQAPPSRYPATTSEG